MSKTNQEIGYRVKKLREAQRFSREKLAEAAEISPRFLYDIEYGIKEMGTGTLLRICNALYTSPNCILLGENEGELEKLLRAIKSNLVEKT